MAGANQTPDDGATIRFASEKSGKLFFALAVAAGASKFCGQESRCWYFPLALCCCHGLSSASILSAIPSVGFEHNAVARNTSARNSPTLAVAKRSVGSPACTTKAASANHANQRLTTMHFNYASPAFRLRGGCTRIIPPRLDIFHTFANYKVLGRYLAKARERTTCSPRYDLVRRVRRPARTHCKNITPKRRPLHGNQHHRKTRDCVAALAITSSFRLSDFLANGTAGLFPRAEAAFYVSDVF